MDADDAIKDVAGAFVSVAIIVLAAFFFVYVAIPVGVVLLGWYGYCRYRDNPSTQARRNRKQSQILYDGIVTAQRENGFPEVGAFQDMVWCSLKDSMGDSLPSFDLASHMFPIAGALYEGEGFFQAPPGLPDESTPLDIARLVDFMSQRLAKLSKPDAAKMSADTITQAYLDFCRHLPPLALQSEGKLLESADVERLKSQFSIPAVDAIADVGAAVEALILPFYSERVIAYGLFADLRAQLDRNQHKMSDVPYTPEHYQSPKLINPPQYEGTPSEIVHGYLQHTPLEFIFGAQLPFDIPDATRFEHHWIVAGSGHGKTQTLQYLIAHDLDRVANGVGSLVVIDSQGDLIRNLAHLKLFAPGQPLHGKLCLIDPTDVEYPVALNLFDVGIERINKYSQLDRERVMNGVLELYDFVLGSLLSAELTQKQSIIFRYMTRLMLHIPGATIHTFRELLEPGGVEKYRAHIEKLDGTARAFFETEFNSKQFEDTKRQVVRRLWGILENQNFERMFSHPKNKLDFFAEMNSGKVILINTAKELLKQTGTEIFGRFFIALIAQVAQERATLRKEDRLATFVYIDECAEYLDQNVSLILEQARKFNVGMILANQYTAQVSPKILESFAANTSIKFAGGVSDKDAKTFSHLLRCTPEFIERQPKGHFAASVRNLTSTAVSLPIPFGYLEALPRMSDDEFMQVRAEMRERYAMYWKDVHGIEEPERRESATPKTGTPTRSPADVADTSPSPEW